MAPLSVLPGRIRLESPDIIGKCKASEYLAEEIERLNGVVEASVNYRTGSILIRFNEDLTNRMTLTQNIKEILKNVPEERLKFPLHRKRDLAGTGLLKHVLLDAVVHTLLPKPFNILLPLAINNIKR